MLETHRESAERVRLRISNGCLTPTAFRADLESVPPAERDAWLDVVLGLDAFSVDDGAELPRGCVPYLPCSVEVLLRVVEQAEVRSSDVFVDVGSGAGRAAMLVHLLTGASAIGIEVQSQLVRAARELAKRLNVSRVSSVQGDAAQLTEYMMSGSVFFLYCPFSGERLEKVLGEIEAIAATRPIRVCAVDLPLPDCSWLGLVSPPSRDLAVYRSTLVGAPAGATSGSSC